MNQTYMGCQVTKLFSYFSAIMIAAMLSACGGGGGSSGTSTAGGSASNGKISLALTDQVGTPSIVIAGANALLVKATVLNGSGGPAVGVVVTFSVDTTTAMLSPASGTALTDANGIAKMSLTQGVGTGAGTVTASATVVGTTKLTTSANFSVSAPPAAIPQAVNFVSAVPSFGFE